jgi:type II secretion system protein I
MKIQIKKRRMRGGFTLLEVMFAVIAFCMAAFTILALVSNSLRGARLLRRPLVDAGVVASQISQTNQLIDATTESGDLSDFLGDSYKGYTWTADINEVATNRLFQVDVQVQSDAPGQPIISKMSILLFRPQSPAGSMDGATVMK